jgi:nitroreductase
VPYTALFDQTAPAHAISDQSIAEFLRCAVGLSAWKQIGRAESVHARWALRVNPSSGNLHPTETYLIHAGEVCHYDVEGHGLERRCRFEWPILPGRSFLVALTSIHWREAWKYGERAFRYCQHDAGHAIGALRLSAALLGWRLAVLPQWSHASMAALLGLDRDEDFADAEREEPECVAIVTTGDVEPWLAFDPGPVVEAARQGRWTGRANRLSPTHIDWPIIDEVATATRPTGLAVVAHRRTPAPPGAPPHPAPSDAPSHPRTPAPSHPARSLILQRRSAVAFDAQSSLPRQTFVDMLQRLDAARPPFDALWWPPHVHLALFVHRVDGLVPGVYAYLRDRAAAAAWKAAMRPEFLWERIDDELYLLVPIDARRAANRVSCDQEIAEDGFFSLGMIARFESALAERGDAFYRQLFWEAGLIGQVLYLEAEAAGARATGIGCYYDEPVHELLGLAGLAWQSLYHFSMGVPVEDARLTTEPGYAWER